LGGGGEIGVGAPGLEEGVAGVSGCWGGCDMGSLGVTGWDQLCQSGFRTCKCVRAGSFRMVLACCWSLLAVRIVPLSCSLSCFKQRALAKRECCLITGSAASSSSSTLLAFLSSCDEHGEQALGQAIACFE
jgi:hypothetical protein